MARVGNTPNLYRTAVSMTLKTAQKQHPERAVATTAQAPCGAHEIHDRTPNDIILHE